MTAQRLPLGLPEPQRSVKSQQALAEQVHRMAGYLQTAAVLERDAERCEPAFSGPVLCRCAQRRRKKAAHVRDSLASQGVTLRQPNLWR